jgi:SHS2 domain-containing protein
MIQPQSTDTGFEEIDHTADWALRVCGDDLSQLLHNAATGMSSLLVSDLSGIPLTHHEQIELDAYDAESLLVNWLSDLAYWAEAESIVFTKFDIQHITSTTLQAAVQGGYVPNLEKHIKAVTYHNLEIVETEDGLEVTIVFDV